jgi:hypothetical protein
MCFGSLKRAYRVLDEGGAKADVLRRALASIFRDGKDQRALEHFLAQTGFLLNDWSSTKPLCFGCMDKCKGSAEYGYGEGIIASRIVRVKASDPVGEFVPLAWVGTHMEDKLQIEVAGKCVPFKQWEKMRVVDQLSSDGKVYVGKSRFVRKKKEFGEDEVMGTVGARKVSDDDWKQLLKCRDGDVLIVDDRVDFSGSCRLCASVHDLVCRKSYKARQPSFRLGPEKVH